MRISSRSKIFLWRKMKTIYGMNIDQSEDSSDEDISIQSTTMLKYYMDRKKSNKVDVFAVNVFKIADKVDSFIAAKHEVIDGTIYYFWESKKNSDPELYMLAKVIFAIAPTQAIVERSFSTLTHTFPPNRSRLDEDLLDDILIICLNKDLMEKINADDIAAIYNEKYAEKSQ